MSRKRARWATPASAGCSLPSSPRRSAGRCWAWNRRKAEPAASDLFWVLFPSLLASAVATVVFVLLSGTFFDTLYKFPAYVPRLGICCTPRRWA